MFLSTALKLFIVLGALTPGNNVCKLGWVNFHLACSIADWSTNSNCYFFEIHLLERQVHACVGSPRAVLSKNKRIQSARVTLSNLPLGSCCNTEQTGWQFINVIHTWNCQIGPLVFVQSPREIPSESYIAWAFAFKKPTLRTSREKPCYAHRHRWQLFADTSGPYCEMV